MIHASQDFIPVLNKILNSPIADEEVRKSAREAIAFERKLIKEHYDTLKELQKWFNSQELDENEPFLIKKEGKNGTK